MNAGDRQPDPARRPDGGAAGPAGDADALASPPPPPAAPAVAHEPPPPGTRFMNGVRWALFAGLLALAVTSVTGYFMSRGGGAPGAAAGRTLYHCPMHPTFTSHDRNAECPICGMDLEPVPANGAAPDSLGGDVPGLASVRLEPERIQMIGVRRAAVVKRPLGGQLDLVGFLAPDEARLHRVQLRVSGWVQDLFVGRTGEAVRAGQPLLTIYSPELYQSEREFLIELEARSGGPHTGGPDEANAARQRLRLLGVPEAEIRRLETERTPTTRLAIPSPVSGTVLERNVAAGQYVSADTPLFGITDLSRLWVLADLYEMDFGRAQRGDRAVFTVDALPGRQYEGRVDFIYPTVSSATRTLKLRVPIDNRGGILRPGMYGRVRLVRAGAPATAVPGEAVVNTGELDYVFLVRPGGVFEPRRVTLGMREGDWVQVLSGVSPGDTVVASASFLIDSESRLKAAISGMGAQPTTGHSGH